MSSEKNCAIKQINNKAIKRIINCFLLIFWVIEIISKTIKREKMIEVKCTTFESIQRKESSRLGQVKRNAALARIENDTAFFTFLASLERSRIRERIRVKAAKATNG